MLLLPIVRNIMKIYEDKYSCGWDICTDVLSGGKEKYGYFGNKSQIFKKCFFLKKGEWGAGIRQINFLWQTLNKGEHPPKKPTFEEKRDLGLN